MRRAAVQKAASKRRPTIPCSGEKFPVQTKRIPCFRTEQGIRRKTLNPFGDRRPNPLKEPESGEVFQGFPVNFPVLKECAAITT
jgi:hypothetical protein